MRTVLRILVVAALMPTLLYGAPTVQGAIVGPQSASNLFQEAMHLEEVVGDLPAAILLYQRVVEEFSTQRSLAAHALVRMGQCYEKLGDAQAREAYERVVGEYSDQGTMVIEARTRLSAIVRADAAATPPTMAARQVWTGSKVDDHGSISPDGRYLSFADWDSGNLAVHDFATGENWNITSGGTTAGDNYAEMSMWSPDGKQLAYTHMFKNAYELRVTGVEGLDSRLLYRGDDVWYPSPGGWSPDGQYLSVSLDGGQIGLLSVSDGSLRILKSFDRGSGSVGRFSPDGDYFAYSYPPDETSQNRDLFLMAVDGSRDVQVTETPADEEMLGWAPDGSLLFKSDRTGRYALWMIGIEKGTPTGPAVMLWADLGNVTRLGTTRDGALYYMVRPSGQGHAFTAAFNPETAEVVGSPEPVDPSYQSPGRRAGPAWSADGKHLAYRSVRGRDDVLVIRSLQSGHERVVTREMTLRRIQWHPDGVSLFVGGEYRGSRGIFQVDIGTNGTIPQLVHDASPPGIVSADGTTVYARVQESSEGWETIVRDTLVRTDLATGAETELHSRIPGDLSNRNQLALSPDNREIVFRDGTVEAQVLKVVSTAGGTPRHLTDLVYRGEPVIAYGIAWTPDGDNIVLFGELSPSGVQQLYRVSAQGGDLEPAGLETSGPEQDPDLVFDKGRPQIRPDGREISFLARKNLGPAAVWVLENFLPTPGENR